MLEGGSTTSEEEEATATAAKRPRFDDGELDSLIERVAYQQAVGASQEIEKKDQITKGISDPTKTP